MTRLAAVAVLVVALGLEMPHAQQPADSRTDRPRFGTSTAAIVVDVIVRDGKGLPVIDLTKDDFQLFENGTPQEVLEFARVLPGSGAEASSVRSAGPTTSEAPSDVVAVDQKTLPGQAVTAIVFDWLSDQSRHEAWKAASTLLGVMETQDFASVYVIDQALRRIVPYTRDTTALKAAFDYAVTGARPVGSTTRSAVADALVTNKDTPLTPGAEAGAPGLVAPPGAPTQGPAVALAAMLARMENWERYVNNQQQGTAVASALLALVEQMSGMPGRKTVVLFSEGLAMNDAVKHRFDQVEQLANRHNVTFYTIDAAGLRVHSRMPLNAAAIGQAGEGYSRGIADDPTDRRVEALQRDPSAGLEPLAERTGGMYVGDTNDLKAGFARINADRRFHYLLAYSSTNPVLDGSFRKIDVRVRRPGVKVRARGGYVASPTIEQTNRRDYEAPAVAALSATPTPSAFPFQLTALSTPIRGRPGLTSLVAAVDTRVVTFREDPTKRTYDGEVTVLARVVSPRGEALATQSQLYELHGDVAKLGAFREGRLLFFRTPEVPPGEHTVEWVVRDGTSGDASVLRSSVDVPLSDVRPVVGDLIIVDHVEQAPRDNPAMARHPLVWKGSLLYPSLGLPISKASRHELTFFLPMLVDSTHPMPATTIELRYAGRSLGSIAVPTAKAEDGTLRQVGTLPIDKLPPGAYELKASIKTGEQVVSRSAAFTLVP